MTMKDIFKRPLEIGQTVAACVSRWGDNYEVVPAEVIGFTPKMVRIMRDDFFRPEGERREQLITPRKLVIVNLENQEAA